MSGRLLGRRIVGAAVAAFGFVSLAGDGPAWAKALLMAACAAVAALLWRRTPADSEWERRVAARTPREAADPPSGAARGRRARGWAVGATALHVLAAPILVLRDLLKMQK